MRASTVFAIAVALLIALAAAATAKYTGLFKPRDPAPQQAGPPPFRVLVAASNLFADQTVTTRLVSVRDLRADEQAEIEKRLGSSWRDKLMPANPTAAHMRVCLESIPADTVLLKEYFKPLAMPTTLSVRLDGPEYRAVTVSVMKDMAGGGTIRVDEYVDVMLKTRVGGGSGELRQACIAKACKVVMKRNSPWQEALIDPDDKPIKFTLQANPYRAALIDYAQSSGQISLLPVSAPTAKAGAGFSDPDSKEYATEDQRIAQLVRGELPIGDRDLARIFNIVPPPVPSPTPPDRRIQHLSGVSPVGYTVLPGSGVTMPSTAQPVKPAAGTEPAAGNEAAPAGSSTAGEGTLPAFRMPTTPAADERPRRKSDGK